MSERKTILIIEQELSLAIGLKAILEKEGYEVVTDWDYLKFDNEKTVRKFDLVVFNVNMPKDVGFYLLRKIKSISRSLPVIAISIYSYSFSKNEIKRMGVDDFITKPFEIENFKERIERLMLKSK